MNRVLLEQLNVEGLRELGRQHNLDTKGARSVLFDRLTDHFERSGWPEQITVTGPSIPVDQTTEEDARNQGTIASQLGGQESAADDMGAANIQVIVQAVLRALESNQTMSIRRETTGQIIGSSPSPSGSSQTSALHNWGQIKFTSKLIPPFSGMEEDDIKTWLGRIGSIGQLHQIGDEVLVLAAVNQLQGRALSWYNRQEVGTVATWEDFKRQIRAYFQRTETVTTTLARVSSRIWKSKSEKFADYAEDKLKLMQFLNLSEKEKIELLADGVKDPALRKFALNTWATSIPEFIEHIRRITEDSVISQTETESKETSKISTTKDKKCEHCQRVGHWAKDCRTANMTCFACGEKGHVSTSCPTKKKTEQAPTLNLLTEEVSAKNETSTDAEPIAEKSSAAELELSNKIHLVEKGSPCVSVFSLGNHQKSFFALVDTGSPVSLIKKSIFEKYFYNNKLLQVSKRLSLKGVNSSVISIYGKIIDQICLGEANNEWSDVTLLVVDDSTMDYDILLGREFFKENKIRLIFQEGNFVFEHPVVQENIINNISTINAINEPDRLDVIMENLDHELDLNSKNELINTLKEVEKLEVEQIQDEYKIRVHLKDTSFFRYAPRRMSIQEKASLRKITDDLLKRGIIKPSISPYCARVVLVVRQDGRKRMVLDLRPLNQRISPQKYPFPIVEDQLDQLYGKEIFTKLDLRDGFHQIEIHPEDTKYFAFATPFGQYEYVKMPFGYSEAPAEFQKRLLYILDELLRSGKILLYIDDILIHSTTITENLQVLREVLITLKKYGLELNLSKCMFLKRKIEFLGYVVSANGITLNKRHTQAITDFKYPQNVRQVQGFLGLTNYFRKFIKEYALKARPLYDLTKKDKDFSFNEKCKQAFDLLKGELTSFPVLRIYNPTAETELLTDASNQGYGAILLQKQKTGDMAPVAYFSKATSEPEKKYHSFELETLAIVKALERFHVYLQGITFRIVTDCNALALAVRKININPRIARWTLTFQNYNFELVHRSSDKMTHVDFLSRYILTVNIISSEDELLYKQLADPKLKEIAEQVELHGSKVFKLIDGILFKEYKDKDLFVVPEAMVNNIIRLYHDEVGHVGVDKTLYGILSHYWFPNLKIKVRNYIDNCVKCLSYSIAAGKTEGEMLIYEKETIPFQTVHIDHFGPLAETIDNFKHILVIIDAFTKFVWLFATKSTGTDEVLGCLEMVFSLLGYPKRIVSDRGTAFTSNNFSNFVTKRGITHVLTAVASPWANGQVERVNRFLKSTLSKIVKDPIEWKEKIRSVQYVINNTLNKAINSTPSKALFGFEQRKIEDEHLCIAIDELRKLDSDYSKQRNDTQLSAQEVNRKLQEYNKVQFDKRHKKITKYKVGDYVLVRKLQHKVGTNTKLEPKYKGPYQVKAILKKNRFVIADIPGYNLSSRPYNTILSADKIKPWIRIKDPTSDKDANSLGKDIRINEETDDESQFPFPLNLSD